MPWPRSQWRLSSSEKPLLAEEAGGAGDEAPEIDKTQTVNPSYRL